MPTRVVENEAVRDREAGLGGLGTATDLERSPGENVRGASIGDVDSDGGEVGV